MSDDNSIDSFTDLEDLDGHEVNVILLAEPVAE